MFLASRRVSYKTCVYVCVCVCVRCVHVYVCVRCVSYNFNVCVMCACASGYTLWSDHLVLSALMGCGGVEGWREGGREVWQGG